MTNPKIRFKKADGSDYQDWVKQLFSELFKEYSKTNTEGLQQYTAGKYGLKLIDDEKIRYDITKHKAFEKNSLVLGIGIEEVGVSQNLSGCVSPIYTTYKIDTEKIDTVFVNYHIKEQLYKNKGCITHKSTRRDYEFENKELERLFITLPLSLEEQKKIANLMTEIDNLIASAEHEVEFTKQLKKAMLQKMFPRAEEKTPEIRFPGFPDDWEQRKLGDQMYIKSRIGWQALTRKEYLETGDYYLITGTDIDETTHTVDLSRCYYVSKERYDMDDKIQVHEGDIIVTKDGTIGKVAMVTGLDKPATLNSHLFVLRDLSGKLDNRFLLQLLNSHVFDAFVESTKTGSTLTGLPQKTFVEFKFYVPQIDEQKRISQLLTNMDNLITLHQRELDAYKKFKKAMMQIMFV